MPKVGDPSRRQVVKRPPTPKRQSGIIHNPLVCGITPATTCRKCLWEWVGIGDPTSDALQELGNELRLWITQHGWDAVDLFPPDVEREFLDGDYANEDVWEALLDYFREMGEIEDSLLMAKQRAGSRFIRNVKFAQRKQKQVKDVRKRTRS